MGHAPINQAGRQLRFDHGGHRGFKHQLLLIAGTWFALKGGTQTVSAVKSDLDGLGIYGGIIVSNARLSLLPNPLATGRVAAPTGADAAQECLPGSPRTHKMDPAHA